MYCYWTGKTVDAEVVQDVPRNDDEGRTIHEYIVAFDGHQARRRFRSKRTIGEKFPVTYRVGKPASMIKGSTTDSIASIIRQNINPYLLLGLPVVGAVCLAAGMGWGKRQFMRRTPSKEITMRVMLKVNMPVETANAAAKAGKLSSTIQSILSDLKPEAAYFSDDNGQRTGYLFIDLKEASQIPSICEPWLLALNAAIELHPVMIAEDLAKASDGIEQAVKKYGQAH